MSCVGAFRLHVTEFGSSAYIVEILVAVVTNSTLIDFELKKVLLPPPLGNFADISHLKENFKSHLLRDVCTMCSGALVSDSLLHMLL